MKKYYQQPAIQIVTLPLQPLLAGTGGGLPGDYPSPGVQGSRQYIEIINEDEEDI